MPRRTIFGATPDERSADALERMADAQERQATALERIADRTGRRRLTSWPAEPQEVTP